MEPMNTLQYLTSKEYGCCNTRELMDLAKQDKSAVETLKEYARVEMTNRGVPIK